MIHVGTAMMQARKARLAEAPAGYCADGQPQQSPPKSGHPPQRSQTQNQPEPRTSGFQKKGGEKQSNMGLVQLCPSLWNMVDLCRVLASTRDSLAAFLTEGRRRGSHILSN